MESFGFELRLVDSVSAASKKAAAAVKGVESSAKKAQKALDFGDELEKAEHQLKRLKFDPSGYQKLLRVQRELSEQRKKMGKDSFFEAFSEKMNFGRLFSAAFLGDLLADSLIEGVTKAVEVFTEGVKDAFRVVGQERTRALGENLSLGKEGGEEFRADIERFTNMTGFNPAEIRGSMLQTRRAGFSQESARQQFATATDIAAAMGKGGSIETVQGILDSFARLRTKGGIGKRQLVEMLGGVGETVPDFYKALGKKLNISAAAAEKKLEAGGKIDPQLVLNMISASINKKQGGIAGTGGAEYGKTLEAQLHKLGGLWDRYLEQLAKSPAIDRLTDRLKGVLEAFDPTTARGQEIVNSLLGVFDQVSDAITNALKPENIDSFVNAIKVAIDAAGMLVHALEAAVNAVKAIDKFDDKIADLFIANGDTFGKIAQINFKKKELAMGSFTDIEKKQRENEIAALEKSLTPSEKVDYYNAMKKGGGGGTPAPAVAAAPGPVHVSVSAPQTVHVHGGETEEVKKAVTDAHKSAADAHERAADKTVVALERARAGMTGR